MITQIIKAVIVCSLALSLLSLTEPVYSAWWDNLIPHSTQEYSQQTVNIGGRDLKITLYRSSLSEEEIRKFYQQRLPNYGWQLKDINPDNSELANLLKKTLYFTKDNTMLNINFLSQRQNDNQTYFSIMRGQIEKTEGEKPETLLKPEKLTSISIYPNAQQVYSRKSSSGQVYGYVTNDSIEKVLSFYKSDMFRFNWSLADEQPVEKSNYDLREQLKQNCPNCAELPEDLQKSLGKTEMYFAALKFKRGDEVCLIGITQNNFPSQDIPETMQTNITLNYISR